MASSYETTKRRLRIAFAPACVLKGTLVTGTATVAHTGTAEVSSQAVCADSRSPMDAGELATLWVGPR